MLRQHGSKILLEGVGPPNEDDVQAHLKHAAGLYLEETASYSQDGGQWDDEEQQVACCMLHVACCMLHVACCMSHVADHVRRLLRGVPQEVLVRHATRNLHLIPNAPDCETLTPRATCNIRHATCNIRHATCNMQCATCKHANMQHAVCNVRRATCGMQHATCDMRHAICR